MVEFPKIILYKKVKPELYLVAHSCPSPEDFYGDPEQERRMTFGVMARDSDVKVALCKGLYVADEGLINRIKTDSRIDSSMHVEDLGLEKKVYEARRKLLKELDKRVKKLMPPYIKALLEQKIQGTEYPIEKAITGHRIAKQIQEYFKEKK